MQNDAGTLQDNPHKIRTVCSGCVLEKPKENPGALAGATGVNLHSWFEWIDTNTRRESAARALFRALFDCDPADRLTFLELIFDALRPGAPIPAFDSIMSEAFLWADWASRAERKAYALACYQRLSEADQRSFVAHITGARHGR